MTTKPTETNVLSLGDKRETVAYLEQIKMEILDGSVCELVMVVTRSVDGKNESAVFGTAVRDEYSLAGRLLMLGMRRLGFGFDDSRDGR